MRWVWLCCALVTACAPAGEQSEAPRAQIKPQDFALIPCGPGLAARPCVLAVAGGKRVLFGTPAGVSASLQAEDLRQLDAVMVFSLRAVDIEGLDEVRNASWWAGRDAPLRVIGPEGTGAVIEALNSAFEQADALRIVDEGIPPGGYDAAVLTGREITFASAWERPFDTGDFRVEARQDSAGFMAYSLTYGRRVTLAPCHFRRAEIDQDADLVETRWLGCETGDMADDMANDMVWPLTETIYIVRTE